VYIIVAIVIIEIFIYFYASFYCENIFSLVLSILVMLVLGTSFAYSRFVVDEFTVKNEKKNHNKKTKNKTKRKQKNVLFLQNKFIGMCIGSKV